MNLDRPWMRVLDVPKLETVATQSDAFAFRTFARYTLANCGSAGATVERISCGMCVTDDCALFVPLDAAPTHPLVLSPIIAAGEQRDDLTEDVPNGIDLATNSNGDLVPAVSGSEAVYLWLRIAYRGSTPDMYVTSACWKLELETACFVEHGGKELNFAI